MRAALWYKAKDMRVEEIPTPVAPPGMALVKIYRTGTRLAYPDLRYRVSLHVGFFRLLPRKPTAVL